MMRYITKCFLAAFLFAMAGYSFAEDWGFSGGFGVKYQTVDFKVAGNSFKPLFVSNTINFTGVKDNFYVSLEYDISTKDHQELIIEANEVQFIDMSRSDTNLTFGYILSNSTSVFIGYKLATIDVKLDTVINPSGPPPPLSLPNNQPGAADVEFKDTGFYIGASYSHNAGKTGSISYSAAFADLDGEVSVVSSEYEASTNTINIENAKTEGKTSGLSLAITFNDGFTETTSYNVALKVNLYEFEDETVSAGDNLSTDETFIILSIGLKKYF